MIGRFFVVILACLLSLIASGTCANSSETPIAAANNEPLNIFSCGSKSWTVTTLNSQAVTFLAQQCKKSRPGDSSSALRIVGEITKDKLLLLENYQAFVSNQKFSSGSILLDSPGGDLIVAMQMGDVIWRNAWGTYIPVQSVCMSACVLVYAAGKYRYIMQDGQLGVHRPVYMDDAIDTSNSFATRYEDVFSKIQTYLDRFGVSRQVADLMRSTPSTRVRLLSEQERLDWGLGNENVASVEIVRQRIRMGCGRKFEKRFYIAQNRIEQECTAHSGIDKFNACLVQVRKKNGVEDYLRCMSPP